MKPYAIHKSDSGYNYCRCGISLLGHKASPRWDRVTCGNCLKIKNAS